MTRSFVASKPSSQTGVLHLRVTPRSSRNEISSYSDGVLHLRVTAPPVEGEANRAVIELVASLLGIPKSRVTVKSGASGRMKTLEIAEMSQNEIMGKLSTLCG